MEISSTADVPPALLQQCDRTVSLLPSSVPAVADTLILTPHIHRLSLFAAEGAGSFVTMTF